FHRPFLELDPAEILEDQRRHDASWLPSYVVASTAAADYPAFLAGSIPGEELPFAPDRLHLAFDYFSNYNGIYAVNTAAGATAAAAATSRRTGSPSRSRHS